MSRKDDRARAAAPQQSPVPSAHADRGPAVYRQPEPYRPPVVPSPPPQQAYQQPPQGYMLVPVEPPRKRGLRKFTWVILVINALFLIWVIAGANSSPKARDCGTLDAATCQSAVEVGTGIGVFLIIIIWVVVDFFLLIIWAVTRPRQR